MRELTIAQCKELEKGEPIPSFRGRITKVYEQKRGTGEYGDWSMQNMIVEDQTGRVQVTWGGEDDLGDLEGEIRLFESNLSPKHGLTGMKWDVRTSNGKTYEGIKLTNSCKIKPVNGYNLSGEDVAPESSATRGSSAPPAQNFNGIDEARQHLCQAANLYNLCVKCVETMVAPELPEIAQTSEQFQATLASFWIETSGRRCTDGVNWWSYIEKMPITPLHGVAPQNFPESDENNESPKVERMPQMRPEDDDCAYPPEEIEPRRIKWKHI